MDAEGLPAFTSPGRPTLTAARGAELRDDHTFLELADRAQYLTDQHARWVLIRNSQICIAVRGHDANTELAELAEDHLGHDQVAGETIGPLDEHQANAVGADVFDQLAQALSIVQIARAAHTFVTVLADYLDAVGAGVAGDGLALAREPVTVDLPPARDPQVG